MPDAEILHLLGVAGVARLSGVDRPVVLQAAGADGCGIADLVQPASYGHFPSVGARYPDAAPMLQSSRGGYVQPSAASADARDYGTRPSPFAVAVAPEYSHDLIDDGGRLTYLAPAAYTSPEFAAVPVASSAPAEVAAAPVYAPAAVSPASVDRFAAAASAREPASSYGYTAPVFASYTSPGPAPKSLGPASYGATYTTPTRERVARSDRRSMGGIMQMRGLYYSNPSAPTAEQLAWNAAAEAGATDSELAMISGTFSPEPSGSTAAISGWPGAVPFRPDAWDFTRGVYTLQQGDTFSGLASTYLQSPARYLEIWQLQPYRYTKAIDPSSVTPSRPLVRAGEPVIMPLEATERAKSLVRAGAPTAPAIGGPVGGAVGAPWTAKKKMMVGAGVLAGVAVIGGGIYYATK
jgi:hypothetical protein